eukprot:TRINITY_DN7619_c0_g1_i1.p1 TRINITY_DN7619_c0_g1~~TRINITY_DN7619_c0_g1_i1.p1  ORF type:complete len:750 (+),score=247.47 TRINITY_DN7619_c0_g1_i1:129-2378(+)
MSQSQQQAISLAIRLLMSSEGEDEEADSNKEFALRTLINFSADKLLSPIILKQGGIPHIVNLLSSENPVLQMLAAWTLSNLAVEPENRAEIIKGSAIKLLIPILSSSDNVDVLSKCLWLITNLATTDSHRTFLIACGVVKLLAQLLLSTNRTVVIETTKPLRNMLIELDGQKAFAQCGGILNLISLLTSTDASLLIEVMQVFLTICIGTDVMRRLVVAAGILPPLIFHLSSRNDALTETTLRVMITLSLSDQNEIPILNAGAVLPIVDLFHSKKIQIQEQAALLLSNLTGNEKIRQSLRYAGLVSGLVESLNSVHPQIVEQAARLITNIAMDDINRVELLDAGAMQPIERLAKSKYPAIRDAALLALNNLSVPVNETQATEEILAESEAEPQLNSKLAQMNLSSNPRETLAQRSSLRRQMSHMRPQLLRREKIAKEFLDTEKSYVENLNVAIKNYLKPLTDLVLKGDPILSSDEIKSIFSIIEIIARINGDFLAELQARMKTWNSANTVLGDIFLSLASADKLKVYTRYINNYDATMNVYGKCRKSNAKFAEYIDKVRATPEVRHLDLLSFLIMPVQRIPRYILLLTDLLKQTPKEHPDHAGISSSLEKIKAVADQLNEAKRKAENSNRVATIQNSLIGEEELVKEGRSFIKEGILLRKEKKSTKYCYFFLMTDILLNTTQKKQKYKLVNMISLGDLKLEDVPDTDVVRNAFKLSWGKESMVIVSEEKQDWVKEIKNAVAELKKGPPRK